MSQESRLNRVELPVLLLPIALSIAAPPPAAAQAPAAPARQVGAAKETPAAAAFSGKVVDTTGAPVAGVQVRSFRYVPPDEWRPRLLPVLQRVTTGPDGSFRLAAEGVPEARPGMPLLVAVAEKDGFGVGCAYWPWRGAEGRPIVLPAADSIAGTVVDQAGKPLEGAQVGVYVFNSEAGPRVGHVVDMPSFGVLQTRTDGAGRFVIEKVPAGASAALIASLPGHGTIRTCKRLNSREPFQFAAGQTDVQLILPPEATLVGAVRHAKTGEPVGDVPLVIRRVDKEAVPVVEQAIHCAADGAFRFGQLVAGTYAVQVPPQTGKTPQWSWSGKRVEAPLGSGASVDGVVVEVLPCGKLQIQTLASDRATPVPGCWVGVRNRETGQHARVQTDKNGAGWLHLFPGDYSLTFASKEGYTATRTIQQDEVFRVQEGQTLVRRVEMDPLPSIAGTVTTVDGSPVEGVEISVHPFRGRTPATTDAEGRFRVTRDPGEWHRGLKSVYLVARQAELNLAACVAIPKDATTASIVVTRGLTVSGRVADADGAPIPRATVSIMLRAEHFGSSLPGTQKETPIDGTFEFRTIPTGQRYTVYAGADGYGSHRLSVPQTTGDRLETPHFTLKKANLSLSGVAVNDAGETVPGVRVYLYGDGQPQRGNRAMTDANGRFEFPRVCAGDVRLSAHGPTAAQRLYGSARTQGGVTDVRIIMQERRRRALSVASSARRVSATPVPKLGEDFHRERAHYWVDFENADAVGEEWSSRETMPLTEAKTVLLGHFGNDPVTLRLTELPKHRFVRIYLELYTLNSWDGDNTDYGPDLWVARVADGPRLVYACFSTSGNRRQSYPLPFGLATTSAGTGGRSVHARLPFYDGSTWSRQKVYPMCFVVPHTADSLTMHFTGMGLQFGHDESWALDNVGVELLDQRPAKTLSDQELEKAWQGLTSGSVTTACEAVRSLVASGDQGAAYLIGKLGWQPDKEYREQVLFMTNVLKFDDRFHWQEAAEELQSLGPRVWPLVFSHVDKRRFGDNPPPWVVEVFDRWGIPERSPERLREARAAHVLELIWTETARRALLFE